uniref:Uncharacterized protein n=1 Tax=Rhizophora mucronata TaxID=61149 RepID=A0A2P2M9P9_RHIMU
MEAINVDVIDISALLKVLLLSIRLMQKEVEFPVGHLQLGKKTLK